MDEGPPAFRGKFCCLSGTRGGASTRRRNNCVSRDSTHQRVTADLDKYRAAAEHTPKTRKKKLELPKYAILNTMVDLDPPFLLQYTHSDTTDTSTCTCTSTSTHTHTHTARTANTNVHETTYHSGLYLESQQLCRLQCWGNWEISTMCPNGVGCRSVFQSHKTCQCPTENRRVHFVAPNNPGAFGSQELCPTCKSAGSTGAN